MISFFQYFGNRIDHPYATDVRKANAIILVNRVNTLLCEYEQATDTRVEVDKDTGTQISGSRGGSGDGGFRLAQSRTGVKGSSHKQGMGVDVYDAGDRIDTWIDRNPGVLDRINLYRESPGFTPGWCHLQTRPTSKRTYRPY